MDKKAALIASAIVGFIVLAFALLAGAVLLVAFAFGKGGITALAGLSGVVVLSMTWSAIYKMAKRT